ncbi:ComC/BlpC family leader-containing pheromone/bacteriocin [Companilactobacillus kimchiensis]|nr:ComC/BlpC family leader-containing pheromone/bacteriocin [Companilactobacillus kimchiensis]
MKVKNGFKTIENNDLENIKGGSFGQFVNGFIDGFTGRHHKH